ncbi:hypothetical protein AX15_007811, partial [Amanita polypyramis BW_CC]
SSTPPSSPTGSSGGNSPGTSPSPSTPTTSACSGLLGLGLGCPPASSSTPPSSPNSSAGSGSPSSGGPPPSSSACGGLLGLGIGCPPPSTATPPPSSSGSSGGSSPGTSPPPSTPTTSKCSGLLGLGLGCPPASSSTPPSSPNSSAGSGSPSSGGPPPSSSTCGGLLGLGIGCPPPSSTGGSPDSGSSPTPTTSKCSGLLGLGLGCPPASSSTSPPSPNSSGDGNPTPTSSCAGFLGLGLGCPVSSSQGSSPTGSSSPSSSDCGLLGLGCGPTSPPASSTPTSSSCGLLGLGCPSPSITSAPSSPSLTFPLPSSTVSSPSTITTDSRSSTITTPAPSSSTSVTPSVNSMFSWITTESSLALASVAPTKSLTITNPDAPTTTFSLSPSASGANVPPLPSGIPYRIYPMSQLPNGGSAIPGYTMISILFNQELNWPFVVSNWLSSSQIFAYIPVLITMALNIPSEQVMTFALQVYVPADYQGPQDPSLLGTIWLGYIPTQYVSTLAAQIKVRQSEFYTSVSNPVAQELAQHVNPAFSLLSINVNSSGDGSSMNGSGSGGSGTNVRRDAIIGVVSALAAIAVLVLGFLVYRIVIRRREFAHSRLSDAPHGPEMAGLAPQGRQFDQDSVGGARRRSFYWAEDSLRGWQPESGEDHWSAGMAQSQAGQSGSHGAAGVVRRNISVVPGSISAPILRESSMNW